MTVPGSKLLTRHGALGAHCIITLFATACAGSSGAASDESPAPPRLVSAVHAPGDTAIRPFTVPVASQAALDELRRRVAATVWPEMETVTDTSQGVQLQTIQQLARYWASDYDWRKFEAKLTALPHFVTEIDGLDIHFIHVRSEEPDAMPVIVTHGWPGSIVEQLKIIDPLAKLTAHGGSASDAFDVVIPSLPGYGFSGKPTVASWDPQRIARAWVVLMQRLGYSQYVAQGGDWSNAVTEQMALLAPPELLGIHTNMAATSAAWHEGPGPANDDANCRPSPLTRLPFAPQRPARDRRQRRRTHICVSLGTIERQSRVVEQHLAK
jgi:hypothetical protein